MSVLYILCVTSRGKKKLIKPIFSSMYLENVGRQECSHPLEDQLKYVLSSTNFLHLWPDSLEFFKWTYTGHSDSKAVFYFYELIQFKCASFLECLKDTWESNEDT
ncbi:hypothetical protein NPIL_594481 [Nephila pilipes]|uniref:Uncharacterized protein n=1 Tax=Nephila pilipes TaxID=299642 RepID=A0A8X6QWG2_NEPPI|nr:hypothetical protein NPIL_594481 [Nephila pilipes]